MPEKLAEKLLIAFRVERAVECMTDEEVADLLDEHVLNHTSIVGPEYSLIESTVARLRRAKGGPL